MMYPLFAVLLLSFIAVSGIVCQSDDIRALINLGPSMDPSNALLFSWAAEGGPCDGSLVGITCNGRGRVANISLESMNLTGKISPAISNLSRLTGLYLHYNSLYGEIPEDLWRLTNLRMLYLNHNFFSGSISQSIGNMVNLEVLELGNNQFTGSIPPSLGFLIQISILSLTSNQLSGIIPEALGDLEKLTVLDLSRNNLSGVVPNMLQNALLLQVLDIRSNNLSGQVPSGLKRLEGSFLYQNNSGLCGVRFRFLESCGSDSSHPGKTTLIQPQALKLPSCNQTNCSSRTPTHHVVAIVVLTAAFVIVSCFIALLLFLSRQRRQKQRLADYSDSTDIYHSSEQGKEAYVKSGSVGGGNANEMDFIPDSVASGGFSHEVLEGFRFSLEEVEAATQWFSEVSLLGKNKFSGVHKGVLKDGSFVAIKSVSIGNCKSNEFEFLEGLSTLVLLRHQNLVRLRGFCCSRGRGECFLVHDFVPNGSLSSYLDLKDGDVRVLEWSTRVRIIKGIARGVEFLHSNKNRPALLHQNISPEKVLLDKQMNPLLSDSGLHRLLTSDILFSVRKGSAAMGYLAPECSLTGRFTEKSDVYAFGMLVFQVLSGRRAIPGLMLRGAGTHNLHEYMDSNLHGCFLDNEVKKMVTIAKRCVHESSAQRPSMEALLQELESC